MNYDFTKREREFGRMVFALTLDRKKMTERIVIGEMEEVRFRLERDSSEVSLDVVRPMGSLLLGFESDPDRLWNTNAMLLHQSYEKGVLFGEERWKMVEPGAQFLQQKYESGEPAGMFTAMRTWEEYLNCYNLKHGPQLFLDRMAILCRPFFLYGQYRPCQEEAATALSQTLHAGESTVELWYPVKKRPFECIVAHASFQPMIFYYLNKIAEWGFVFQECKVCGKFFLARSRHYELCSDKCRKVQAVEAKRQFDERAKDDRLEQLHEAAYYYWYNRIRKLRKARTADPERLAVMTEAFQLFRAEAKVKKAQVKRHELPLTEFSSWLVIQQEVADELMGNKL